MPADPDVDRMLAALERLHDARAALDAARQGYQVAWGALVDAVRTIRLGSA